MGFDLATLARPPTRAEALRNGLLVDTSAAAAFLGFRYPSALSAAAWDEVVGTPGLAATREERRSAADRLRQVWTDAERAVRTYRSTGGVLTMLAFTSRTVGGRKVDLRLVCSMDGRQPVLTIHLPGES